MEKEIINNIPSIIYRGLPDSNLTKLFINKAVKDLLGYEPADIIQNRTTSFAQLVHIEDRDKLLEQLNNAVKSQSAYTQEYRLMSIKGGEYWVQDKGQPIFDDKGFFLYIDGVITNVHSYKIMEKALMEYEQRHNEFLHNLDVGVLRTKIQDGSIIEINDTLLNILGYKDINDVLSDFNILRHYADTGERDRFLSSFVNDRVRGFEIKFKRIDGKIIWFNCSAKMNKEEGYIDSIYINITAEKLAAFEAEKAKAQLLDASKYSAIGTLAGGLAHEISTPANVIMGYTDVMLDYLEKADINRDNIRFMLQKQAQSIKKIESILSSIKVFGKKDNSNSRNASFHTAINNTINLVSSIYKNDYINIQTDLKAQNDKVTAPIHMLQQIVFNIIENAKDAIVSDGRKKERLIKIITGNENKLFVLKIFDNGIGIPQENITKIFDPFFTTKAPGEGTGMGLSVVYSNVKSLNGDIAVYSKTGEGTEFRISVPFVN